MAKFERDAHFYTCSLTLADKNGKEYFILRGGSEKIESRR